MSGITIKELAELCGVAVSTVSRAMNDRSDVNPDTRARILAAAREYGYVPNTSARSLKVSSTRAIAVIIQGETSPLLVQVLGLLESSLGVQGYDVMLSHVSDRAAHAGTVERIVTERKFGGVILLGRYGDQDDGNAGELSRDLARIDVPLVFCTTADFSGSPSLHSSVSVDDFSGSYELTRRLLALGHRRIAFVGGGSADNRQHPWALRYSGYRSALADAGLPVDPTLQIDSVAPDMLYTMANGYRSTGAWLAAGRPDATAIMGMCDAVAIGAGRALHEAGIRVPTDCSLTGFDGLDIAQYAIPSLTTVRQPLEDIARATGRVLLSAIAQPGHATEQLWIRGELVEAESTAPPRA